MTAGGASFATGQVFTVAPGRGFCFFGAAASPALWQPLRGKASCRRNCVRTSPRLRHRTVSSFPVGIIRPALSSFASLGRGSTISAGSLTLVTGQVFTIAVSDHASSSPAASYCQGRASVWLVCGSPFRCGSDRRSLPQPSRIRLRPPAPTPRSTAANEQPVPALAVAGPS